LEARREKNVKDLLIYLFAIAFLWAGFCPAAVAAQEKVPAPTKRAVALPVQNSAKTDSPSAIEQAILNEINAARKAPQNYAQYLEDYKRLLRGKRAHMPDESEIETVEGAAAIDEAIDYLRKLPGSGALAFSEGLNKVARLQLKDLTTTDSFLGHKGSDGSDLAARIKKIGAGGTVYAENITFYGDQARTVVLMMIVDDGVKSRIHRKNLFNSNVKIVGIAFGKNKAGRSFCVVDFADRFFETSPKSGIRQF
jgi:uncharacterized protein YkwD